jgi:alpha-N-arabinofuranosidase
MKYFPFLLRSVVTICLVVLTGLTNASAEVVTYPAPPDASLLSSDYVVEADGKPVTVYRVMSQWQDGKYSMATFDFSGSVTVKIKIARPLDKLVVLPAKYGIKPVVRPGEATFTTNSPFKISFEPTGYDSPLLIFGNDIEQDAPKPGDPNVIYFGPGVHQPGKIELKTGQTLYLAGGAVVKGGIETRGDNIRILGRGILDGSAWEKRQGPTDHMIDLFGGANLLVKDITIRAAYHWTLIPQGCDRVTITNVKICGSRYGNDDGINPCHSSNVVIRDCFIRTDDDCIAIKGTARGEPPFKATENIEIANCTLWTDYANVFRLGYESRTAAFRNFSIHDIDVIHSLNDRHYKEYWTKTVFYLQPTNNTPMENIRFENIRVNGEGRENLVKVMPMPLPMGSTNPPGKSVRNVTFKNIEVYGETGGALGSVYVAGVDAEHVAQDITFDHVVRYGNLLTANSPELEIGPFASGIAFVAAEASREIHVAVNGSDANSGGEKDPLRTINHAAQVSKPGDKVVIHSGVYREQVTPARGGTSEHARIVYLAAPGEKVVVKGSEPVTAWQAEGGGVWRAEVPDTVFGDFNPFTTQVSGPKLAGDTWRHLGEVYLDGVALTEQQTREAVNANANTWLAQKDGGVTRIWTNFGSADPTRQLAEINVRAAAIAPVAKNTNYVTIDGLTVAQTAGNWASADGVQPGAISTGDSTHWIIQNSTITDAKCVAIATGRPGRDLGRTTYNRPAFSDLGDDLSAVGHHLIRNNLIQRCGQAGIFGLLHGSMSEISGNQIEDINAHGFFAGDEIAGIRLAVAIDTVIRDNLVRRVHGAQAGYGIGLGPLYQGVRLTGNVVTETERSCLFFTGSHGPALVDNNVFVGPGAATGEGIKLRDAEANVFVQNLFADCGFASGQAARGAPATSSYRPHSLVIKQTIPALALDDKWFSNIFIRAGLDQLPKNHGYETDYNAYLGGAAKTAWADAHSAVVGGDGGFKLISTDKTASVIFDLNARPRVTGPAVTPELIGRFALTQSIEQPDGRPIVLMTDFFGNAASRGTATLGPFARYQTRGASSVLLFECRARLAASAP